MADDEDVRQVLLHPAIIPALEEWLAARGLEMRRIGVIGEDDLPSWIIGPTDETMRRLAQ